MNKKSVSAVNLAMLRHPVQTVQWLCMWINSSFDHMRNKTFYYKHYNYYYNYQQLAGMATLQCKSCGPYLSASAMKFMKRRYTNVRPLPFFLPFSALPNKPVQINNTVSSNARMNAQVQSSINTMASNIRCVRFMTCWSGVEKMVF